MINEITSILLILFSVMWITLLILLLWLWRGHK